jgi:NADPH:quinone reductase-like Zn-dependent oxidoreductase
MKAILIDKPGDETVLRLGDFPEPVPGPADLLIAVKCAGLNRADLMQRQGFYPPPPGASPILGLECAGEVMAVGAEVRGWNVGDRAMALLAGGGYAQRRGGGCYPRSVPHRVPESFHAGRGTTR